MNKILLTLMLGVFGLHAGARQRVEATIAADAVSQYIWRGQELGQVSLQPTLGLAYKGLSLTAWGSVGLSDPADTKELDMTVAYTFKHFHVGVTDYWFNRPNERYFVYDADKTSHVFEANVGYDFQFMQLNAYTNFGGNDGLNKHGNNAYSTYLEAAVPFSMAGLAWTATAGAVPYATTFYSKADGFAVTNLSLRAQKDVAVSTSFTLPLFAQLTLNPSAGKTYLVVGLTLRP